MAQRAAYQARHNAGMQELGRTMAREHIEYVQNWMAEHCGGPVLRILPGESPYETFARLDPPALVRAVWLMVDVHVLTGCPISLAPEVAEVYLSDPDAYPCGSCDGCGYPMPIHGTVHPDGSFSDVVWYEGKCPVCGLDNHPKEGSTS